MRKLRALVITSDKHMGSAFCDIVELEGHHVLQANTSDEWQIVCVVYKPDIILSYENSFFCNTEMLDYFCGHIPIVLTAWGYPDPDFRRHYAGYEITYLRAPCDAYDVMNAFDYATASLKDELSWLDVS